jgi:hypothetical protein
MGAREGFPEGVYRIYLSLGEKRLWFAVRSPILSYPAMV